MVGFDSLMVLREEVWNPSVTKTVGAQRLQEEPSLAYSIVWQTLLFLSL